MAVSSWRMRKDVTCETGAERRGVVMCWRKRGRREFRRHRREIRAASASDEVLGLGFGGLGGVLGFEGVEKRRRAGLLRTCGLSKGLRRRVSPEDSMVRCRETKCQLMILG